jgi:hypothetical protein
MVRTYLCDDEGGGGGTTFEFECIVDQDFDK